MINEQEHPLELLPWFVNGTLSSEEQYSVDKHVTKCEQCKAEIELLQKLEQQIKRAGAENTPGQLGFKRLTRQIKQEHEKQNKITQGASKWWQPAMAAAILVIVIQTSMLLKTPEVGDAYVPLGVVENTLQVRFSPNATELQIRHALNAIHGRIVDGPGALGVYRIKLELAEGQLQSEQIKKAIDMLEKQPGIIHSVAP